MGESGRSADSSNKGLPAVLVRNKRKFLGDVSLDIPFEASSLSLTEFPRYEMLEEKFQNALNELGMGSLLGRPEEAIEEEEVEDYLYADWNNPIACQLEELLTNNLFATFSSAVKKIVECGYPEEAAEWAVLNSSLFHGSKDAVSNVLDGALALLKREKEFTMTKHPVFEGLQSLVDYTLLEMIHVMREVRPALTIAEAMWCLLISDLNLVNACALEALGETPTLTQSKSETSGTSQSDSDNFDSQPKAPATGPVELPSTSKPSTGEMASPAKEGSLALRDAKGNFSGVGRDHIRTSSQGVVVDEKSGGSRKGSSTNSKRDMLRQKKFQLEKNHKGRLSKGAFKAKVAAMGSMVLDKSLKPQSGSSGVLMKGAYSKSTTPAGTSSHSMEGNNHPSIGSHCGIPVKDPAPEVNCKSHISVSDTDQCPKGAISVSNTPKATDYYALIPFDEALQKYVPQDERDVAILMLVPHKQALEKELEGWRDWVNEKVMQAARRLGKDQGELKMLRQEKEEAEKFKKEQQTMEESTMKRLSEMKYALANATGQIEMANCTVRRFEAEYSVLKYEMEAAKLKALGSATNLRGAMLREQETLKKLQSWDAEKGLVMEQLTNLRRQIDALNNRLDKAKERQDQFKVLLKQEEREKSKATKQIDGLRRKKENEDALVKVEADRMKQMAEIDMQKCKDSIKNLENMISELRLESDKSKIAALNVGYGSCLAGENVSNIPATQVPKITKRLAVFQDNFGAGDVKPERECVMCMTEEISVVFLPCAHQVLCSECSILHEKKGMNDCPSCRRTIQKRVSVSYRGGD